MLKKLLSLLGMLALAAPALAVESIHPGGFPTPVGPTAVEISWLYNIIFVIIAVISVVVVVPILYILWKYRRDKVSKPATFSHSLVLELIWTIVPALICVVIAVLSYRAMIMIRTMPEDAMNVEVVAYQFGWDFYYPDVSQGDKHVSVPEPTGDDPEVSLPGAPRQTKTLIVPVGKPIVLHVTAQDVIHAFFVPHLGTKIDAIPGRINYAWFTATEPGDWLGQCAELCGQAHGEMFFRVKAVPQAEFDAYLAEQVKAAGIDPSAGTSPTIVTGAEGISGTVVMADPSASMVQKVAGSVSTTASPSPTVQ
ncbi:MAG: cytochrome c oxidase subunit II [Alphaproteobacteria bacterium]|nr:MAG: cytochrome c oxidase subunit II [Alphaproteobacteria bacterium]